MTLLLVLLDQNTCLLHNSQLADEDLLRLLKDNPAELIPGLTLPRPLHPFASFPGFLLVQTVSPAQQTTPALSAQQSQVLQLLMEGLTHKEIAAKLNLSKRMVEEHAALIKYKLRATTIAQTVGRAVALGYWHPRRR